MTKKQEKSLINLNSKELKVIEATSITYQYRPFEIIDKHNGSWFQEWVNIVIDKDEQLPINISNVPRHFHSLQDAIDFYNDLVKKLQELPIDKEATND